MTTDPQQLVAVDLHEDERRMLVLGLADWGGPAYGSDALAVAMGFSDLTDLEEQAQRIRDDLLASRPLSVLDWTRALVATEIAFVSEVLGTGIGEWTAIRGVSGDGELQVLVAVQGKVPHDRSLLPD